MLDTAAAGLPEKSGELQSLAGQLYWSWDKLLVDMEVRGSGRAREYDQKIRTVKTRIVDVAEKKGDTTSEEKWVDVSPVTYQAMEDKLGMAVEHKPAGKYDSEAEKVAQPAGFAYMAPLSQGRNQYGYWEHRDGGNFWVWYGQYALLRDLLWGRSYRPLPSGEYENYRSYQSRGRTYYGRDESASAPKYGTRRRRDAEALFGQHLCARRRLLGFEVRDEERRLPRFPIRNARRTAARGRYQGAILWPLVTVPGAARISPAALAPFVPALESAFASVFRRGRRKALRRRRPQEITLTCRPVS